MLPDHDGVELCRRLREWSEMPILVLSAIHDEQKKIEALHAGADDYVTKPFGPGELVARVQAALRRAGRDAGEPRVRIDRLTIDLAARAVYVDEQQLHLTPIEFSLLRTLVLNRGMLMTHSQLLSEVWGPQYTDATTVLRTHIANLRRKLRVADPEDRLIRTDPGVGYRLLA
jgi:two-component system KDP operon response regulator KdpE